MRQTIIEYLEGFELPSIRNNIKSSNNALRGGSVTYYNGWWKCNTKFSPRYYSILEAMLLNYIGFKQEKHPIGRVFASNICKYINTNPTVFDKLIYSKFTPDSFEGYMNIDDAYDAQLNPPMKQEVKNIKERLSHNMFRVIDLLYSIKTLRLTFANKLIRHMDADHKEMYIMWSDLYDAVLQVRNNFGVLIRNRFTPSILTYVNTLDRNPILGSATAVSSTLTYSEAYGPKNRTEAIKHSAALSPTAFYNSNVLRHPVFAKWETNTCLGISRLYTTLECLILRRIEFNDMNLLDWKFIGGYQCSDFIRSSLLVSGVLSNFLLPTTEIEIPEGLLDAIMTNPLLVRTREYGVKSIINVSEVICIILILRGIHYRYIKRSQSLVPNYVDYMWWIWYRIIYSSDYSVHLWNQRKEKAKSLDMYDPLEDK